MDRPPRRVERLLQRAVRSSPYADDIVGDLHEAYTAMRRRRARRYADCWYGAQAARLIARYALRFRPAVRTRSHAMDRFAMDIRLAARSLVKRPVLAATVVATLALGIGANAAVFGIIDALVLHPYSLRDVDRLVMPVHTAPNDNDRRESLSVANFLDLRRATGGGAIRDVAAFQWWEANLMGRDEPEHAVGFKVTSGFFATLGVTPALGRVFVPEEETHGLDRKVLLSDGLWRRRFGADPAIVGQTVLVDGAQSEVVGIMPPGFDFPMGTEIWSPLAFDPKTPPRRTGGFLTAIARLAPNATIADAQAEMSVLGARLQRDYPRENKDRDIRVYTLAAGMRDGGLERVLGLWQAAALFVLLIACANIANLLLARGAERGREIAVRLALGSSRGRIVRESMIESLLLAAAAVPVAVGVASVFLDIIRASMPARVLRFVPGWQEMGVDLGLTVVTFALGAIAAIACGALPALQLSRGHVAEALKSDGRTGAGPGRQRLRRALVVAELALVLPLLVCAVLSVRSVTTYLSGWQGYDSNGLLVFKMSLPPLRYPDADSRRRFVSDSLQALAAAPGVERIAAANILPASGSNRSRRVEIEGRPAPPSGEFPSVAERLVSEAFFDTMRLPLRAGRGIEATDRANTLPVVVISESLARKLWPEGSAIGARLRVGNEPWVQVVGICGDVIDDWFSRRNQPTMYRPIAQLPVSDFMIAVRTAGDPYALVPAVQRAMAGVDRTQPLFDIMSMRDLLSERTVGLQFVAGVMGTFAGLALGLSMLGLYAVMSYLVAQRVREIGVRLALGATTGDVTKLALAQAARLTGIGIAIGVVVAVALGRLMEVGLLGVTSSDLVTPLALAVPLVLVGLASSYLPARRAAGVDPMMALRTE